jgi:hypothetical protein
MGVLADHWYTKSGEPNYGQEIEDYVAQQVVGGEASEVDNTTVEISNAKLQVKDLGITNAKLATDVKVGSLGALIALVSANSSVVAAINLIAGWIGDLSTLTTTAQGSLVSAINEVLGRVLQLTVVPKTDTYNVALADTGKVFTMTYATSKTFNLPAVTSPNIGIKYTFVKLGAGAVVIQANTGQYISDSSPAGTLTDSVAAETYATLSLVLVSTTQWVITAGTGTWVSA